MTTLNQLDLLNAEELLELARDNVLAVDGYNLSEIVLKVAHWKHQEGWEEGSEDGYRRGKLYGFRDNY